MLSKPKYTVDDLFSRNTPYSIDLPDFGNTPSSVNQFTDGMGAENLVDGNIGGIMQSSNFVSGTSGWRIKPDGTIEAKDIIAGAYIQVFVQAGIPTSLHINDIWYDSDDDYHPYTAECVGATQITAGEWVSVRDAGAGATQTTIFYESTAPASGMITGDYWIDSDDNKIYRYDGANWGEVQDNQIATAIANAATAQSTADGKIITFYQDAQPTADGTGDLWIDTNDNNKPYRWSGSAWQEMNNPSEWADVLDGATTKPADSADVTSANNQGVAWLNEAVGSALPVANTDAKCTDADADQTSASPQSVAWLTAGTITSKIITLAMTPGAGDVAIKAGKTDFGDTTAGFILGIDDSDGDKAKFEIGNATDYLKWDGSNVKMLCSATNAIHIQYGSDILLEHGGDIKFTSVTAPTACTATLVTTSTGNVNAGTHKYKVTFVNEAGETELGTISNTVTTDTTHKQVGLTAIPISSSGSVTKRKIYRTKAGGSFYYLLTEIANNTGTTYTDNTADVDLTGRDANSMKNSSFGKLFIDSVLSLSLSASNSFVGQNSGANNTTGYKNSAIGYKSLYNNTTGSHNSAIGVYSLYFNTSGDGNSAIGYKSLYFNTEGNSNSAIGVYSLYANTTGYQNSAIGYQSLYNNTTGDKNTAIGCFSLYANSTGLGNIGLGYYSGRYETGSDTFYVNNQDRTNTAGEKAKSLIYGIFNSAVADQSLRLNASIGINTLDFGSGKVVLALANASTVPSANPTGGGVIYCEAGALKYRGSSGTITTLANA